MDEKVFDREDLLDTVGGDTDLLDQLVEMFLTMMPQQMASIKSALERGDCRSAEKEAHKLKGVSANLRALSLQSAFSDLEYAARRMDTGGAAQSLIACGREFDRFRKAYPTGSQP